MEDLQTYTDQIASPDLLQVDEALSSGVPPPEAFTNKEVFWIQDQQNGVYTNQIVFDTTSLANSGKWMSYQEGYILVPFNISFRCTANWVGVVQIMILLIHLWLDLKTALIKS